MKSPRDPGWRRRSLLAAALLAGIATTGCRKATTTAATAAAEGRLLLGNGTEPSTLDPQLNTGSPESMIISALWEPLVRWNASVTELQPAAAERWSVSADGRTYTFHLRRDARWSNGEAVTAAQWARSFLRLLEPSLGAEFATRAYDLVGAEDYHRGRTRDPAAVGLAAPDDHTLVLRLRAPTAGFLDMLVAYPWVPVHIPSVEAAGGLTRPGTDFTRPGKLLSNGPYRLAEWRPNQFVRVEANPHFRAAPRLRELRFYAIESIDTEERAYRTGQLHGTNAVPSSKVPVYQEARDPALRITPRIGTHFLMFNVTRAPFQDARVRRALALALDRRQLVERVLRTGETPARALVYPVAGGYEPAGQLEESLDEARRLLAAAGFPEGRGFPAVEYLYNTSERNREVAEAIQQMWRRHLGIAITLRNEEWKVFLQTRTQGHYQVARAGWLCFCPEPLELYELVLGDSPGNETKWKHAGFDAKYWQARGTLADAPRRALYAELDRILHDEMPIVPFAYYTRSRLLHPAVTGWQDNLLDTRPWEGVGVGEMP
jgi:oligopeptide transport system substrate-binding protein